MTHREKLEGKQDEITRAIELTKAHTLETEYWIYPGERRPVVVKAETEKEAIEKVHKSGEYDGFPVYVYRVDVFSKMCEKHES